MKIQAVPGLIDEGDLGFTLIHEHLLANPPKVFSGKDPDLIMDDVDKAVQELRMFIEAGGKTLVEATPINYGREVGGLIEVARRVPEANIVASTGFYVAEAFDQRLSEMRINELAELMIREIREGMDGTSSKAGVIKVAAGYFRIHPLEEKALRAAARAHLETGAPIQVHTTHGTMALEISEVLEGEGAELRKVLLLHMDDNMDKWLTVKVLGRGVNICFDKFARVKYRIPEEWRIKFLEDLIKEGFESQLMISMDAGRRSYYKSYGGGPGLEYLPKVIVPRLLEMGWDEKLVKRIFFENPREFLKFSPRKR